MLLVAAAWAMVGAADAATPDTSIFRAQHPWARFAVGAWRYERVVTESFDETGRVAGATTTETRTRLKDVAETGLTLIVETSLEVAGKTLTSEPREVVDNFFGEPSSAVAKVREVGTDTIEVGGRTFTCQVHEVELVAPSRRTILRTWLARRRTPLVVRRQGITTQQPTGAIDETTSQVAQLHAMYDVLGRPRDTVLMNIVRRHAKGRTVTQTWQLDDVPGEVVGQTTEEFDASGRLTLRSKLELVGYASK